jgi:hypothetical protein
LLCRLRKGIEDVPAQALLFDAPFATRHATAQGVEVTARGQICGRQQFRLAAFGAVKLVGAFVVVFMQLEIGQRLLPAPLVVAGDLRPLLVVARLAAHVDHAVDAGAAAEHAAARVAQLAAVQSGIFLGEIHPVGARVANAVQVTHRDVDPVVVVFFARLHQQDPLAGVGTEPVGQQTPCGACADDDVVKAVVVHGLAGLLSQSLCLWNGRLVPNERSVRDSGWAEWPICWREATDEAMWPSLRRGCGICTFRQANPQASPRVKPLTLLSASQTLHLCQSTQASAA